MRMRKTAVKQLCEKMCSEIPLYQPARLNEPGVYEKIRALKPDLLLVVAYGLILPQAWLQLPRYGCVNVHASLLPRWRGAAPIERAIIAGDKTTGITIMQMDQSLDGGPVLMQQTCPIGSEDGAMALGRKLQSLAISSLDITLKKFYSKGAAAFKINPQDDDHATLAPKIAKHEQWIDWQKNAHFLQRLVRALDQRSHAQLSIKAVPAPLKVVSAQVKQYAKKMPVGTVLANDDEGLLVTCAKDALLLKTLKIPGKQHPQSIADLRNGYKQWFEPDGMFSIGTILR